MGETVERTVGPPGQSGWVKRSEPAPLSRVVAAATDPYAPRGYKARSQADVLAIVKPLAAKVAQDALKACAGLDPPADDSRPAELLVLSAHVPAWYETAGRVFPRARRALPQPRESPEVQGAISLDAGPVVANAVAAAVPALRRSVTSAGRAFRAPGGLLGPSEVTGLWLAALSSELAGGRPQFGVHLADLGPAPDSGYAGVLVADLPPAPVLWTRRWRRAIPATASASWWLFGSAGALVAAGTVTGGNV